MERGAQKILKRSRSVGQLFQNLFLKVFFQKLKYITVYKKYHLMKPLLLYLIIKIFNLIIY